MKRALTLFLALLMVLSLCACGGDSGKIELTLDNYETYLKVNTYMLEEGTWLQLSYENGIALPDGSVQVAVYPQAGCELTINGASENFNYNDVKVVAHVTGRWEYRKLFGVVPPGGEPGNQEVDLTLEAIGNITGQGRDRKTFKFPADCYSCRQLAGCNIEIVEVSGALTPA